MENEDERRFHRGKGPSLARGQASRTLAANTGESWLLHTLCEFSADSFAAAQRGHFPPRAFGLVSESPDLYCHWWWKNAVVYTSFPATVLRGFLYDSASPGSCSALTKKKPDKGAGSTTGSPLFSTTPALFSGERVWGRCLSQNIAIIITSISERPVRSDHAGELYLPPA